VNIACCSFFAAVAREFGKRAVGVEGKLDTGHRRRTVKSDIRQSGVRGHATEDEFIQVVGVRFPPGPENTTVEESLAPALSPRTSSRTASAAGGSISETLVAKSAIPIFGRRQIFSSWKPPY
jgi:hypothetical protein